MSNEFTSNENKGIGLDEEHLNKVLAERQLKASTLTCKIEKEVHDRLREKAKNMDVPKSFIVQELIKNFLKI